MMVSEVEMELEPQQRRMSYVEEEQEEGAAEEMSREDDDYRNPFLREPHFPITLKFQDVTYKIKVKAKQNKNGDGKMRSSERTILSNVSGMVMPGETLAMMGPSGSGKTSLLTALGGRLRRNHTGTITYSNRPFSASMKRSMGFVTQDDVLYPHLTVFETLLYTALLRLPSSLTRKEKAAQAEAVVEQLGLTACRDSIVGGALVRGVSGGERKRVSIGQEMLINPSLIFLDEPTSGLDATTAQRIVSVLWGLARAGRTVVMTIHQPSSRLFYMFDKILLMADGSSMYFGKGSDVMPYFAGVGYAPSVAMNPSDFLLDLASGVASVGSQDPIRAAVKQTLFSAYANSIKPRLDAELAEARNGGGGCSHDAGGDADGWCTSWWQQFHVLLQRDMKERRHESFSSFKIVQVMLSALLAGLLWWQSGARARDQVGLFYFITGYWAFTPVFEAIFTFPQERSMLEKERSSGMYRLSSYFMARSVSDLPMELLLPIFSITTMYWMAGLRPTAASFLETLSVVLLGVLVAQGLGLAIGALSMNLKTATTVGNVIMLAFMLAGGFFIQKVPPFVAWTKYLSLFYYPFKLTMISQFSGRGAYRCEEGVCYVQNLPQVKAVGLDDAGISVAALVLMAVGYRLIAYVALMRVGAT